MCNLLILYAIYAKSLYLFLLRNPRKPQKMNENEEEKTIEIKENFGNQGD